jgi:methyl-accepting chemotaxis protein
MDKIGSLHMRRWLRYYLLMVMLTSAAMCLVIYLYLTSSMAMNSSANAIRTQTGINPGSPGSQPGMELSLLLIFGSAMAVNLGIGYAWYRITSIKLERPVRVIQRALSQLARGQLNETVAIDSPDEFGQIGAGINELAANIQELLLYIWKQTGQCLALLEHIQNNPDLRHDRRLTLEGLGYLKQLAESIDDLREMAKSYVFYDVSLDDNKTQAINEPGQKSPYN